METLVLRLLLPPVTVLLAGWLQHRLGPGLSGRLVGLPLTSGPFLLVLVLTEGPAPTVTAARGVVTGQLMVVGFAATYAALATARRHPGRVLAATVPAVALLAAAAHAWLSWPAALAVAPLAAAALFGWRPEPSATRWRDRTSRRGPGARELAARAALTTGLVAGLSTAALVLGPSLAGLLASVPLVIAVVAPATHTRAGAASARTLLRGTVAVVPGTAAFATAVATGLMAFGATAAFGLALAVMLTVNGLVGAVDRGLSRLSRRGSDRRGPVEARVAWTDPPATTRPLARRGAMRHPSWSNHLHQHEKREHRPMTDNDLAVLDQETADPNSCLGDATQALPACGAGAR